MFKPNKSNFKPAVTPDCKINSTFNPLTAKLFNLNFHPLEVVSRWRDPQLQASENYSDYPLFVPSCTVQVHLCHAMSNISNCLLEKVSSYCCLTLPVHLSCGHVSTPQASSSPYHWTPWIHSDKISSYIQFSGLDSSYMGYINGL